MLKPKPWVLFGLLIGLWAGLCACQNAPLSAPDADDEETLVVDIVAVANDRWQVKLHLPAPANRIVFSRSPSAHIREDWVLVDPTQQFSREGARDVISAAEPFELITFEVPSDDRFIRADYSLTQSFENDQGVVLYLGHFVANREGECPDAANPRPPCPIEVPVQYHIDPGIAASVWFRGKTHSKPFEWDDERKRAGFAYFGAVKPTRVGGWDMLIDPNVPAWMRDELATAVPEVTQLYGEWFGVPLSFRPQLLFSMRGGSDFSASGGVVDDMVQFTLTGDVWQTENEMTRQRYFYLIAHETAHFWNGGMFHHNHNTGDSWMHEGGADAVTRRVMLELNFIDADDVWQARTTSFNERLGASHVPLKDAGSRGRFRLYYPCGEIIELVIEGLLRERGYAPSAHWKKMYKNIDKDYSRDLYFSAVEELVGTTSALQTVKSYITEGMPTPEHFVALLSDAGIYLEEADKRADGDVQRAMVRHLQKLDCQGNFSITGRGDVYTLLSIETCERIPEAGLVVSHIAGHDVETALTAAYGAMSAACNNGASVELQGWSAESRYTLDIPCTSPFQYVHLLGWAEI